MGRWGKIAMKRADPFQSAHAPLQLGGSELFLTFFDLAIRHGVKRLEVISPYMDDAVFADPSVKGAWIQIPATAETTIVVRNAASAAAAVRAIPRRTCGGRVLLHDRLHLKLFIARCSDARFALAGSLNFTGAALHRNEELGLLLRSRQSPTQSDAMARLCAIAAAIKVDGRTIHRYSNACASHPVPGGTSALGRRTCDQGLGTETSQVPVTARNISFGTNNALNTLCISNAFEEIP